MADTITTLAMLAPSLEISFGEFKSILQIFSTEHHNKLSCKPFPAATIAQRAFTCPVTIHRSKRPTFPTVSGAATIVA